MTRAVNFVYLLWCVTKHIGALRLPSLPVPTSLLQRVLSNSPQLPPPQQEQQQRQQPPPLVESPYKTRVEIKDVAPYAAVTAVTLLVCLVSASATPAVTMLSAEGAFFAFCTIVASTRFNPPVAHKELASDRPINALWGNIFSSLGTPERIQDFFASWFFDVPFERIRVEDALTFIAWALFSTTPDRLDATQHERASGVIARLEWETTPMPVRDVVGARQFPARTAEEAPLPSMRHSIEPLRWVPKPASLYVLTQFLIHTVNVRKTLSQKGFVRRSSGKLTYWIHAGSNGGGDGDNIAVAGTVPLLFFHGIGGLFVYIPLVEGLLAATSCPVVLVELPYVSLHVALDVPSIEDHVSSIENVLATNGFDRAILVGHSFGTNVMSWWVGPSLCVGLCSHRLTHPRSLS